MDKNYKKISYNVRTIFLLTLILGIFFGYDIGIRPFAHPDEGRYVEIAREMVVNNDYITPTLNDVKYFEKPALFYWMQAATIKLFGINEWSMRLLCVVFAILGCLFVYFATSKRENPDSKANVISVAVLATNLLYYAHSRIIILDLALTTFVTGALWCFYIAFVKKDTHISKNKLLLSFYALCAFACLTKGLIGVILPGVVISLWIVITRNWHVLKQCLYIPGIILFLAIFLPWHILVANANEDFLHFYFVIEHFLRYTTTIHCRYQPVWFFIPIIVMGIFPWCGFMLTELWYTIKRTIKNDTHDMFFILWIGVIFAFYSFSNSKLIPYILPILAPIAFLVGNSIDRSISTDCKYLKQSTILNLIFSVIAFVAFLFYQGEISDVLANDDAAFLIDVFVLMIIADAILLCFLFYKKASRVLIIAMHIFIAANMMWAVNKASTFYQEEKKPSTKDCADAIKINLKNDDMVFCYNKYYQDFPVYLNKTVGVINYLGELEFGVSHLTDEQKALRFPSCEQFTKLWNTSKQRIFLLLSRTDYADFFIHNKQIHTILVFNKHFVVIVNKPKK